MFRSHLNLSPEALLFQTAGGDSKTLMFVQISPNDGDVGETLCSLNFASRVRGVELGPARKQLDSGELFKYKQLVYPNTQLVIKIFQAFSLQGLLFLGCTNVFITLMRVNTQAERAKQEGRSKEEAVKKLEDSIRNTEAKLKAKEQMCQTLTEKVSFSTLFFNKIVMSHVTC